MQQGQVFVEMIRKLLQHLLEYRSIIRDEVKEHRMSCIVNLLVMLNILCMTNSQNLFKHIQGVSGKYTA